AEEELVAAIGGAVLSELPQVEDLAHAEPDHRDHHPVPGLARIARLVRTHLAAPGVETHGGDLALVNPVACLEGETRSVASRVAPPAARVEPLSHLAGPHDHEVPGPYLHALRGGGVVEVLRGDGHAVLQKRDVERPSHIEQHAAPDHPVLHL